MNCRSFAFLTCPYRLSCQYATPFTTDLLGRSGLEEKIESFFEIPAGFFNGISLAGYIKSGQKATNWFSSLSMTAANCCKSGIV